mmetsp:Transcript_59498/g.66601  ORF Transcript_59498/g.66601 Transcript_59498/m.66601 type:complete len:433 (+) Transcript_59498:123-1421(+)
MRWLAYKPKSTNYSICRPSNSTQNNMSMVGPFMLASIFVGVAIIMGDTSHAFASLSSSTSSMNGDRTGIVNSDPWNSKLYNSASSTSSSSSSSSSSSTKMLSVPVDWDKTDINTPEDIKTSEVLSLDSIRASLIRQEETIIFALIERAQFRQNKAVYEKGELAKDGLFDDEGESMTISFLEYMLTETEKLHASVRRYRSPEEHAFYPERLVDNSDTVLKQQLKYRPGLLSDIGNASDVNFNEILLKKYIEDVVPSICAKGDDEQHGSSVLNDVAVLQALSKRVHYGKFVAESKYLADPDAYQALVDANDADGVMKLLTNEAVEVKVLRRARFKAATYGTEPLLADLPPLYGEQKAISSIVAAAAASAVVAALETMADDGDNKNKVNPSTVESIYRDFIIPLTKDVEVAYLFLRCGKEPPPEYAPHRMSTDSL